MRYAVFLLIDWMWQVRFPRQVAGDHQAKKRDNVVLLEGVVGHLEIMLNTKAGTVRELTRSSRSKFKMVWHQFSTVQFPSHQFVWKVRTVQLMGSLQF